MARGGEERVIVITGVTRGLGRALAVGFVEGGHTVVGCGRGAESIRRLQERFGRPHEWAVVDVSSERQVKAWARKVEARHGPPDLLINNAAVINHNAVLWEVGASEFDQVIDVNVKGVANVLRHFIPGMVARRRGVIVNFSSGWGRSTSPEVAPYCASKWAIEGLSKALAQELPEGMASVPLNPGVVNTAMLQSCFGAAAAQSPSPEAWARAAVPLLLSLGPRDNGRSLSVA